MVTRDEKKKKIRLTKLRRKKKFGRIREVIE